MRDFKAGVGRPGWGPPVAILAASREPGRGEARVHEDTPCPMTEEQCARVTTCRAPLEEQMSLAKILPTTGLPLTCPGVLLTLLSLSLPEAVSGLSLATVATNTGLPGMTSEWSWTW